MSNQSGISVSPQLLIDFPQFIDSDDFAAILSIDHEQENVNLQHRVPESFDTLRSHLESANEARYLAIRLPEINQLAFVLYMPDNAPISFKMKYASSHATVFRELGGSSVFQTTIFWTDADEVSEKGLKAHQDHEDAPAPLTEEEQSLQQVKEMESLQGTQGSSIANQSTLSINAKLSADAESKIGALASEQAVVLAVSLDGLETIEFIDQLPITELSTYFSKNTEPCYVILKTRGKTTFVVYCPRTTTIKQRMVIASTRISFLNYLKEKLTVDTVIETFDASEDLKEPNLSEELGLNADTNNQQESVGQSSRLRFQKPRPPKKNRG